MNVPFLLSPDFSAKTVRGSGSLAVGELASVEVCGVAGYMTGLRVRLRHDGRDVAMFPLSGSDEWSADGDSAKALIELNTVELRKCFCHLDDNAVVPCIVVVESNDGDRVLICKGSVNVKNWPAAPGQVPVTLATWQDDVAELRGGLAGLSAALGAHTASASAHKALFDTKADLSSLTAHAGTVNAHGVTAAGIGAAAASDLNAHTIDLLAHQGLLNAKMDKSAFAVHTDGQQLTHGQLDVVLSQLSQFCLAHDHGDGGGSVADHRKMSNIGTKTHNELEELIGGIALKLGKVQGKVDGLSGGTDGDGLAAYRIYVAQQMAMLKDVLAAASGMDSSTAQKQRGQFNYLCGGLAGVLGSWTADGIPGGDVAAYRQYVAQQMMMLKEVLATASGMDSSTAQKQRGQFNYLCDGLAGVLGSWVV